MDTRLRNYLQMQTLLHIEFAHGTLIKYLICARNRYMLRYVALRCYVSYYVTLLHYVIALRYYVTFLSYVTFDTPIYSPTYPHIYPRTHGYLTASAQIQLR